MPDVISIVWYCSALVGLVESARKIVVSPRVGREISCCYLAAGLALVASSMAVGAPATRLWAERAIGAGNVAFVIDAILTMAAMVCVAGFLRSLDRLRMRVRIAAAVFLACTSVFLTVYVVSGTTDPAFGLMSDPCSASRLCSLIYLGYVITWLVLMAEALWTVGCMEEWPLSIGAFLAGAGIGIGILGFAWKVLVALGLSSPAYVAAGTLVTSVGEACGLFLFVLGSVFAAAMQHAHDRAKRVRRARQVAAVEQLWRLLEPVRVDAVHLRGEDAPDLQQQIVEIFDAHVMLRRFVNPVTAARAIPVARDHRRRRRRPPGCVAAAVELAVGLHQYRQHSHLEHGHAPRTEPGPEVDAWPQATAVIVDDDQRIGWLADVAEQFEIVSRQLSKAST